MVLVQKEIKRITIYPDGVTEKQIRPAISWNGDLSKAIPDNRTSFTPSFSGQTYEIALNDTGTKLFISNGDLSGIKGQILEYTLTTPRDITTATNQTARGYNTFRQYPNPCFADGGNKLFVGTGPGNYSQTTYSKYELGTAYDISSLPTASATYTMENYLGVQSVSPDGTNIIFRPASSRALTYTQVQTPRTLQNSQTALLSSSNIMCGTFCDDGNKVLVADGLTLKMYELGTQNDLSTLNSTPIQTQTLTGISGNPWGLYIDPSGDNVYMNVNNVIYRYHLI